MLSQQQEHTFDLIDDEDAFVASLKGVLEKMGTSEIKGKQDEVKSLLRNLDKTLATLDSYESQTMENAPSQQIIVDDDAKRQALLGVRVLTNFCDAVAPAKFWQRHAEYELFPEHLCNHVC